MTAPGETDAAALAARLVVGLSGPEPTPAEEAWLARWRPAGVLLFARNVADAAQLTALCRRLCGLLPADGEIVADHEGGPVSALAAAVGRPPGPACLGLAGDPGLTRRVHRETAARLRECGLTRVLAPCADVLVEPRNPVIGGRAFGADPELVAAHVAAAVGGLREGGLRACLKHWPGHGGTRGDSHDAAVSTGGGAVAGPFVAGLAAGADAVMVGHLPDPEARDESRGVPLPATLAPTALARLRRLARPPSLLVFADDITMGGLRPAMAALGVAPGAPAGWPPGGPASARPARLAPGTVAGLLEPEELTLPWLAALAQAGCDRLLCRGIPWRALPLPAGGPPATAAAPAGLAGGAAIARAPSPAWPEAPVYAEARARALQVAGGDPLPAGAEQLLWLDCTAGDRWGEAAALQARLADRFVTVQRVGAGTGAPAPEETAGFVRAARGGVALLVTTHRPLAAAWGVALRGVAWGDGAGGALALGHPSLGEALAGALPAAWRVTALPELSAEMLDRALGAGGGAGGCRNGGPDGAGRPTAAD